MGPWPLPGVFTDSHPGGLVAPFSEPIHFLASAAHSLLVTTKRLSRLQDNVVQGSKPEIDLA